MADMQSSELTLKLSASHMFRCRTVRVTNSTFDSHQGGQHAVVKSHAAGGVRPASPSQCAH